MDIRQFQTFKSAADLGSFTKAAQALQYSQATITSHIQQLEGEIGYPLFDRLGKRIALTVAGKELYPYVMELLTAYAKIKHISEDNHTVRGELRVGASETMTVYKLGPVLSQFKRHYPDVTLSLINDNCMPLREMLHTGELDVAITLEPIVEDPQLIAIPFLETPLVFVGGIHLATRSIVELMDECIIFSEKNCSLRRAFESYMEGKAWALSSHMEFTSMEAMKQCIVSGLGISLMPHMSVEGLLRSKDMAVLRTDDELTFYGQVCYHKNKWISRAHRTFIDTVLAQQDKERVEGGVRL
ncbi:LysR family transcriptional regulator [Paenibacillus sp. 1011MAR3C5]|uniref:LysR family transcriptional regulator n=1 Tax=Paenibacillus sp. 1011MAR3C5 TaxID=1675787 RepID=UPI000E6B6791|nr:LysR family transcriptional regulator [Paenibacillus sp. 1011MAR3C5]RJE85111.1 LysR family transcriptional regulator [Paenibacillus sp. 1011MAR3C5]